MKKFLIFSFVSVLILSSCSKKQESKESTLINETDRIANIAKPIVKAFKDSLLNELTSALQKGGPDAAVTICNTKALEITEKVARQSGGIIELKRISNKYRNTKNAPDGNDITIISNYEADFAKGIKPPDNVIVSGKTSLGKIYYYYEPLKIIPLCLNCHGDPAKMDAGLVKKLKELYPGDKATGYKEGDFRGLVRVKINEKI